MRDDELLRYSRHILLPQIDIAGQEKICAGKVLVIGLGGLGCPVALYLAASGVGELFLADGDSVELTNLQRQIAFGNADINLPKAQALAERLQQMNPDVVCTTIHAALDAAALAHVVPQVDVVVDCTDNFAARFAINTACVVHRKPLVSGAAIRMEGQLAVYDARRNDSPCYRCLYPEAGDEDVSCAANGVLAPLVGVIGSLQALEVLKLLAAMGDASVGKLLVFDAATLDVRTLTLRKDPACPVCSKP